MTEVQFHNRRAVQLENELVRVSMTVEGGHIAELLDKATGVNPLWIPPWASIEISSWSAATHPEYGNDAESKLLAGIMGHNLCLDLFGPPSQEEWKAGIATHGEANVVPWDIESFPGGLTTSCTLPAAHLGFKRTLRLEGRRLHIHETVENLCPLDRPIAWTQHVTLGPPFLADGKTQFRLPATKSRGLGETNDFNWPFHPRDGKLHDLRVFPEAPSSSFTTHLMDPTQQKAWFTAWSPQSSLAIGYVWDRADFPWLGIWEENCGRSHAPWNQRAKTRGLEFGVSPFPESRRKMIERGSLFGEPACRWIAARGKLTAEYYAAITPASEIPETYL